MHRADMLKVLVNHLPEDFTAHFGKRLVSYTEDEDKKVSLTFADGTTAKADLLVEADGVSSATRETMYERLAGAAADRGDANEAKRLRMLKFSSWSGTYAYRTLLDTEKLLLAFPGHQAATNTMAVGIIN